MKRALLVLVLMTGVMEFTHAQTSEEKSDFIPEGIRQYQFNLPKEGQEIQDLRYDPSGEPLKGTLTPDGNRVIMQNYRKGSRVKMTVVFKDGTSEELVRSPCYIDPVTYEL